MIGVLTIMMHGPDESYENIYYKFENETTTRMSQNEEEEKTYTRCD